MDALSPHAAKRARAWVLNLDAELELMRPERYQPTKGSLLACAHFAPTARALLQVGDIELARSAPPLPGIARGYVGAAWCPTPSILTLLARAGASIQPAPSLGCLQTVNHRSFHARLGQTLPGATFASDFAEVLNLLTRPSPNGWMVKRGFGFAARGVRRMPHTLTPDDVRWITHALEYGGVQVEPWVPIIAEYSLHGHVGVHQSVLGSPCQLIDPCRFTYCLVQPRADHHDAAMTTTEWAQLLEEGHRTASALKGEGYIGPFGIDAFAYWWAGKRTFNPRSEVNARYTLAYAVGMHAHES